MGVGDGIVVAAERFVGRMVGSSVGRGTFVDCVTGCTVAVGLFPARVLETMFGGALEDAVGATGAGDAHAVALRMKRKRAKNGLGITRTVCCKSRAKPPSRKGLLKTSFLAPWRE